MVVAWSSSVPFAFFFGVGTPACLGAGWGRVDASVSTWVLARGTSAATPVAPSPSAGTVATTATQIAAATTARVARGWAGLGTP